MADEKCVLVGQSGGPTAAINSSLAGVIAAGILEGARVEGMRYGIQGFLDGNSVRLDEAFVSRVDLELLRNTPASWLGSCRFKLPDSSVDVYQRLFERFEEVGATAVLYIGGNDSMDTIAKLGAYGSDHGSDIRFIGVPKTIDNDLVETDHTPGYGSAARFVATAMNELAYDADVYNLKSVTFVEIMGRDAGWLAASSALSFVEPDVVLLPEAPVDEDSLLDRIAATLEKKNTVMVGVSEGIRTPDGTLICERAASGADVDEFGHLAMLSGASRYLAALTKQRLGCKARAVELSTLQRCASYVASKADLNEAFDVGHAAVEAAFAGETTKMCAIERVSDSPYEVRTRLVDVLSVANKVKNVPREWIADDGMGVKPELIAYMKPLVGELPAQLATLD